MKFEWTDALVDEYALRMEKESLTIEKFKEIKDTEESSKPFEFEEWDAHWLGIVASITNEKHLPTAANFLRKQMNIVLKSKQKGTANDVLNEKPPLGLKPFWLHNENRLDDIDGAIRRYKAVGKEVPKEWINERESLVAMLQTQSGSKHLKHDVLNSEDYKILKKAFVEEPQQESKRIEVENIYLLGTEVGRDDGTSKANYLIKTTEKFNRDKFPAIKSAIEKILNNE